MARFHTRRESFKKPRWSSQLLIPFMTKDYPQPSAKLTEMRLEENCPFPQDCKCGVYGNGKYAAESTHQSTETLLKPWLNLTVYQTKSTFHHQSKKKPQSSTEKHSTKA